MTPFDLLRRYFTATGIGQVAPRLGVVDGLAHFTADRFNRRRNSSDMAVPAFPISQDAKEWTRGIWQDIDDAAFRRR